MPFQDDHVDVLQKNVFSASAVVTSKNVGCGIPIGDQIANNGQTVGNCILGNHFAVGANPFAERDVVRGGE